MREPQETCSFRTEPSPSVAEQTGVLWVPEKYFSATTSIVRGTALADFLPGVDKGDALNRGYDAYTLTENEQREEGYHCFYFNKPKDAAQAATPIRSYNTTLPSYYWPPVVTAVNIYKTADGTYTFKPRYKQSYDGPTKVLIEEFFAPDPHTLDQVTAMRPQIYDDVLRTGGVDYDNTLGSLVLERSLHPAMFFNLVLDNPITVGVIVYNTASLYVPATNYTDWPASLVIADSQRVVSGGYLRQRETAYAPL